MTGADDEEFEDLGDLVDPDAPVPRPRPAAARRKTFGGAMLAAAMIGVQEALEGPKDDPVVLEVTNAEDNDDDAFAVDLDPYDPSNSVAVVRPWLHEQP